MFGQRMIGLMMVLLLLSSCAMFMAAPRFLGPNRVNWQNSQASLLEAAGPEATIVLTSDFIVGIIPGYLRGGKVYYIEINGRPAEARCTSQVIGGVQCTVLYWSPPPKTDG